MRSGDDLQDSSEPQEEKRELAYLERTDSKSETLGLTMAESKVIESRLRSSHWRNPRWSSLVVTASDGKWSNKLQLENWQKPRFAFPEKLTLPEKSLIKCLLAIVIGLGPLRWLVVPQKETSVSTFGYGHVANASSAQLIDAADIGGELATHNLLLEKIWGVDMTGVSATRKADPSVLRDDGIR